MKRFKITRKAVILGLILLGTGITVPNSSIKATADTNVSASTSNVASNPDAVANNNNNVPEMSLSQVIKSGASEAILTDIDIPSVKSQLDALPQQSGTRFLMRARSSAGRWVYMYTAEPYAFYRNSKTKKWKVVQVTPTTKHVINTMINGYVNSYGNHVFYKKH